MAKEASMTEKKAYVETTVVSDAIVLMRFHRKEH